MSHSVPVQGPDNEDLGATVTFGKYAGMRLDQLGEGYIRWCIDEEQSNFRWYTSFRDLVGRWRAQVAQRHAADPGAMPMTFGKYNGRPFAKVYRENRQYIEWCVLDSNSTYAWHSRLKETKARYEDQHPELKARYEAPWSTYEGFFGCMFCEDDGNCDSDDHAFNGYEGDDFLDYGFDYGMEVYGPDEYYEYDECEGEEDGSDYERDDGYEGYDQSDGDGQSEVDDEKVKLETTSSPLPPQPGVVETEKKLDNIQRSIPTDAPGKRTHDDSLISEECTVEGSSVAFEGSAENYSSPPAHSQKLEPDGSPRLN